MMSSNTNPKTWQEAMGAADVAQWIEGLEEEMASLRAHNMFVMNHTFPYHLTTHTQPPTPHFDFRINSHLSIQFQFDFDSLPNL